MAFSGWERISAEISAKIDFALQKSEKVVIVVDCYPGTNQSELLCGISKIVPSVIIHSDNAALLPSELDCKLEGNMTNDRVFGVMSTGRLIDCFHKEKILEMRKTVNDEKSGVVLVYGVGAALITKGDILVYSDMSRWEIQLRYRKGEPNWRCENNDAPILSKYKRGFFAEWRFADKHKRDLFPDIAYLLDTNRSNDPAMVTAEGFSHALVQLIDGPFRTVPYFDPGVWGGQWMKDVCGLDKSKGNFAWSFDGVPEENSLLFSFESELGEITVEIPAMDLVLLKPRELLGERVYERFGAEFPIRFDLLDTMGGQNLSLQVHPLTEYIQENFNMHYTQDESYYILETGDDPYVFLGVKTNVDRVEMMSALKEAESGGTPFDTEKYVNCFPVKKHDHVLIPAGTVHCSGKNTMVLEVSATPYIFTFKLWDWGRLGLDGLPRPTHLIHGEKNIQWNRDTKWVERELLHREKVLHEEPGCKIERTGLHECEFIDTIRYTLSKSCRVNTGDSVNVWNLVDGEEAIITSPTSAFEPFVVHYAETFIVPANVGDYVIAPKENGKEIMALMATVK